MSTYRYSSGGFYYGSDRQPKTTFSAKYRELLRRGYNEYEASRMARSIPVIY